MGTRLYWTDGAEGRRYRLWQTTADEWYGDPMTREEFTAYIAHWPDAARWLDMIERGKDWVADDNCDHGLVDSFWLGSMAADCEASGHVEPRPDGSCSWCGYSADASSESVGASSNGGCG